MTNMHHTEPTLSTEPTLLDVVTWLEEAGLQVQDVHASSCDECRDHTVAA